MKKSNIFDMWRDRGLFMTLVLRLYTAGSNPTGLSNFSYSNNPQNLIA